MLAWMRMLGKKTSGGKGCLIIGGLQDRKES